MMKNESWEKQKEKKLEQRGDSVLVTNGSRMSIHKFFFLSQLCKYKVWTFWLARCVRKKKALE